MEINNVSLSTQSGGVNAKKSVAAEALNKQTPKETAQKGLEPSVVYEKTEDTVQTDKKVYTRDSVTLSEISRKVEEKLAGLRGIVENLFTMQNVKNGERKGLSYDKIMKKYQGNLKDFYQDLVVDEPTRLKAQQEISEDGFWGVKQTSERAIQFAIGLSGGDSSKLDVLKNAIEKGYKQAEKAWGGELPDICQQTKAATLKGLDDWASGACRS